MMSRPSSMDLRERVVAAVGAGQSCRAVARLFDLGPATVRAPGRSPAALWRLCPQADGGRAPCGAVARARLALARIAAVPHATVRGLRAELAACGTRVSNDAVGH